MAGTTYVDAFEQALTETDESTLVGQSIYKFGTPIQDRNPGIDAPFAMDVNESEKMGLTYSELSAGNYPMDNVRVVTNLINGVGIYGMYGKATHTVANTTQTVTNFTTTEKVKPRYTCVEKIGSLYPHVIHGVLFHDMELSMIPGEVMIQTLTGKGCKHHIPDWELQTPTYPSSLSSPYNILDYSNCKWGADGSETAFNNIVSVNIHATHKKVTSYTGDDGYYLHNDEWSPIKTVVALGLKKEEQSLMSDAYAGTLRSLTLKFMNGLGYSITFDSAGNTALCHGLASVKKLGEIIGYNALFTVQNPTWTITDHVADTFYAIPT